MNIYIGGPVEVSDMQGPCPSGFHVPLNTEWQAIYNAYTGLGLSGGTNFSTYLKLPMAGCRDYDKSVANVGSYGYYWSSSTDSNANFAYYIYFNTSDVTPLSGYYCTAGETIRCLKNTPATPTSSRTVLYQGTGSAGIYYNSEDGLISISSDGSTWYTLMDKNLGATTVYNYGDTLTNANCGNVFQRGNNYAFPGTKSSDSITTSSTQVDASTYGPGNYYSSSTWISYGGSWSNPANDNLRGGETQGTSIKSVEVKNIYIGEYKPIYKGEYIEYKMNADYNGNLYIPTKGMTSSGSQDAYYARKVSVDGGAETTYTGASSYNGAITLSGYTSGTNHTIKIVPTSPWYGWARAYSWYRQMTYNNNLTEIVYDASYIGYADSETSTGNYFRYQQYYECEGITKPADEYLPDTVTTIGNYFRRYQYFYCNSLLYSPEESLPNTVTSIGQQFRQCQYQYCTSLNEIKGWKDLSTGSSPSYYRESQYSACTTNKTIKVLNDVIVSSYPGTDTLNNDYVTSVYVPSQSLNDFKTTSNYPWIYIDDSKFIGY